MNPAQILTMNILFLCVSNSARSQIAEAFAKELLPKDCLIFSAGSSPTGYVHPLAIETMQQIDIDISGYHSKSINDLDDQFMHNLDFVITLCSEEVCPTLPSEAKLIKWPNEDPANPRLGEIESKIAFKKTRENIYQLVKKFMIDNF